MNNEFLIFKYTKEFFNDEDLFNEKYFMYDGVRLKVKLLKKMLNYFLTKYIIQHKTNFRTHSKYYKKLYTNKYRYYIEYLIENELIYISDNYEVGIKSYQYTLTNKLINIIGNPNFKLESNLDASNATKSYIIDNLYEFDINTTEATEWLNKYTNISVRAKKINKFTLRNFNNTMYYNYDVNGRLHTKFTSLKKELRQKFVKTKNGENTKEIDIANSQPLFLNYLMYKNDVIDKSFKYDVLNGLLYDKIGKKLNINRNEAKVYTFKILFGKNNGKDNIFDKLYPITYSFIKKFKQKNYKRLSKELQKIESNFMFNNVCPALHANGIKFITIHDSIIIPESKYYISKLIFSNLLKEIKK